MTAKRGYKALSIPAMSSTAGVSNQTFYEHFTGKEEALLEAFEALSAQTRGIALPAFAAQEEWADGIAAGIGVLLTHISTEPVYAQLAFFELPSAGPAGLERSDVVLERFTGFLNPETFGASTPITPSPKVIEAIGGGIWAVIRHEVANGRAESLPELAPQIAALVLVPFGVLG